MKTVHVLGFAGSLRKESFNRALLRAASEILPQDVELEIFELEGIPPFNAEQELSPPDRVRDFKGRILAADALLIVTPEYNYSIPGVLKNAIDWASRPSGNNSFNGKPAAIMSASTGYLGGARAQYHLRQVCVYINLLLLNKPEVMVTFAGEKFDVTLKLTDERTREHIQKLLDALAEWTRKIRGDAE
jgi:chromate reductase